MTERLPTAALLALYAADLQDFLDSVEYLREWPEEALSKQNRKQLDSADEIIHWLGLLAGPADGDPRAIGWIPRIPITGRGMSFTMAFASKLSKRPGIRIFKLDGTPFRATSVSQALGNNSEPLLGILGRQEDVTGESNGQWNLPTIPHIEGWDFPAAWNIEAQRAYWDIPYGSGTPEQIEEAKDLIRNYDGPLNTDWRTWRGDLALLYDEGHPGARDELKGVPEGPRLPGMLGL